MNLRPSSQLPKPPRPQGLYDPRFEHDACGVGMVCHIKGTPSHQIIQDGLQILRNLSHRGAYGCDAATGDGAGILMQSPHRFLKQAALQCGIRLPRPGRYACGPVFLPPGKDHRQALQNMMEAVVREEGQTVLGWRRVPTEPSVLGPIARAAEPAILQLFIGRAANVPDTAAFERKLLVIRKVMENRTRALAEPDSAIFHIPSLSSRTVVYKGMFLADQIAPYFPDLTNPAMESTLAVVHQRYSTNTFPTWDLAHPFRFLCHNGEINTLRGNINWMNARQHLFQSDLFGTDMAKLLPIATPQASDSANLDHALELLYHTGRPLAHCMMMLIPEAWQAHQTMPADRRAFYEYHACLMEPWDGPACIIFTDGRQLGAVLDRNGLRPARYTVTTDDRVVLSSETGVIDIPAGQVRTKGRLQPGRMFLIDLDQGRLVADDDIKARLSAATPYATWLRDHLLDLDDLPEAAPPAPYPEQELLTRQQALGYTLEDHKFIIGPMALTGKEPVGSMGDDIPPAILSEHPRPLFDYFRQLFAQVTNPPLDAIREELVTSLAGTIGAEQDLFAATPAHCRRLRLARPLLTVGELARIRANPAPHLKTVTLQTVYPVAQGGAGLQKSLAALCNQAASAIENGAAILVLSDRAMDRDAAAMPSLLVTAGIHHHLIQKGLRTRCGLIVETGEARETHHLCCLLGYGANAINPYLALAAIDAMSQDGRIKNVTVDQAVDNYIDAACQGILKVMSKMGISTLQSYCGAQIFEAVGLDTTVIDTYFCGTPSRIGGADLAQLADRTAMRHQNAYPATAIPAAAHLPAGGKYQWRRGGERHQYNPQTIAQLQQAVRQNDRSIWRACAQTIDDHNRHGGLIRGLLAIKPASPPVPLDEVEPWTQIVKRFKTGAMSYGSISREAHETLAVAMNRIGGKSNSGEGGEDADRYHPDTNGDRRGSSIKQIASGRFGVTGHYLVNATELQIKMAQGAKPGEGGQLPGYKVYPWIARTRHATPYVPLISPPPHHDIYSIEDLAQLIFDLKNANPDARISVKLVSEIGVGTIAAGVVKGLADVVLISGDTGGTGASPLTAIRHGGLPWELGLAETQQTLVMNGLRHKIVVECDGQLKTARDVAVACLLGAEEFGFGTAALIALGCVMMRVCHLNTCPVGVATQDPELRKKFTGRPEHVIAFMRFVAEDLREIMARLGFRTLKEMVGQTACLDFAPAIGHWRQRGIDLSRLLHQPEPPPAVAAHCAAPVVVPTDQALDHTLIEQARPAIEDQRPLSLNVSLRNTRRTVGTLLSSTIVKRHGAAGLPEDTLVLNCKGSAGQSFCAFGAPGLTVHVAGEANDYFGKGLSGAKLSIRPPAAATFKPEENIIIGNVAFYGATSGEAYINGVAGERFCVRNSGVTAVVEGIGDHGCEYMTGGRVAVLGPTGRNFAAGMSGGIAYVFDPDNIFARQQCNRQMVALEALTAKDNQWLRAAISNHRQYTGSPLAGRLLDDWAAIATQFVKVMPTDYKKALARIDSEKYAHGKTNRL